jgi:hypothetical protein
MRDITLRQGGPAISLAASCLLALAASACVKSTGTFTADGFQHTRYPYRVVPGQDGILDREWRLDNFRVGRDGKLQQKSRDDSTSVFQFDTNDDGTVDSRLRAPTYDLRYEHRIRDGVIWLRTFPISATLRQKELRVLMQAYVDQIAGAGYENVGLDDLEVVERRFAAEMLERGSANVAGREAYLATVDVANVDQIRLTPSSRATRVRLVMVRSGFFHTDGGRKDKHVFPVLMMACYANLPEDFERDLPSFERFLGEIQIAGQRGWKVANLEKLAPPSAAQPPPAAQPAPAPPPDPQPAGGQR